MVSTGNIEVDVELKSTPEKFWRGLLNSAEIFPKAFPEQYKSIEILEGDGKSVGSVRLIKFTEAIPLVTVSKEKIELVDESTKTLAYSVIDGEMVQAFKSFKANVSVNPKGEGSLVKWSCKYEKAKEEVPEPSLITEFTTKLLKELDAYLLKSQA